MKNVAYQTRADRHGGDPREPAGTDAVPRPTNSQQARAKSAGSAHRPNATDQCSREESGAVSDAPSSAPPMSPVVYKPVTGPTRVGKRAWTTGGSSAPATAMPTP